MNKPELSIEFFPPQTQEGAGKLKVALERLTALESEFYSVTYGAGGTTRERTFNAVNQMVSEGYTVAPHLSCVGSSRDEVREILYRYRQERISRIVAIRGDLPSGMVNRGELRHADELVSLIRQETGEHFRIYVAAYPECHPQSADAAADLRYFARKMAAGANCAITQYFYNADAYFYYVDEASKLGVKAPIIPGVLPIISYGRLARFSENCGAEIPLWMRKRFEQFGDDSDAVKELGMDIVTSLCERLLQGGAPGLHFYCMNQATTTLEICRRLGLGWQ